MRAAWRFQQHCNQSAPASKQAVDLVPHPICSPGSRCSLDPTRLSMLHAAGPQAAAERPRLRADGSGEGQPAGISAPAGRAAASAAAAPAAAAAPPATSAGCRRPGHGCCRGALLPHRLYSTRDCGGWADSGTGGSAAGGTSSRVRSHTWGQQANRLVKTAYVQLAACHSSCAHSAGQSQLNGLHTASHVPC